MCGGSHGRRVTFHNIEHNSNTNKRKTVRDTTRNRLQKSTIKCVSSINEFRGWMPAHRLNTLFSLFHTMWRAQWCAIFDLIQMLTQKCNVIRQCRPIHMDATHFNQCSILADPSSHCNYDVNGRCLRHAVLSNRFRSPFTVNSHLSKEKIESRDSSFWFVVLYSVSSGSADANHFCGGCCRLTAHKKYQKKQNQNQRNSDEIQETISWMLMQHELFYSGVEFEYRVLEIYMCQPKNYACSGQSSRSNVRLNW